jgi:hypothetical protein
LTSQKIIPRAYNYLKILEVQAELKSIAKYSSKFSSCFDEVLVILEELESLL